MKKVKQILSGAMTIASVAVLFLALGMVDMELSLLPIIAFFAALAWLVHVIKKVLNKGEEECE